MKTYETIYDDNLSLSNFDTHLNQLVDMSLSTLKRRLQFVRTAVKLHQSPENNNNNDLLINLIVQLSPALPVAESKALVLWLTAAFNDAYKFEVKYVTAGKRQVESVKMTRQKTVKGKKAPIVWEQVEQFLSDNPDYTDFKPPAQEKAITLQTIAQSLIKTAELVQAYQPTTSLGVTTDITSSKNLASVLEQLLATELDQTDLEHVITAIRVDTREQV